MSDGMAIVRTQWIKEKPSWPTAIAHAAKRKRLGLSLNAPLGTADDPYLAHMSDEERHAYSVACRDRPISDQAHDVIWGLRRTDY